MGIQNFITKFSKLSLIIATSTIFFTACSKKYENLPELNKNTNEPFMHKIESQKLKSVMHELEHLVFDRFYSEIDRDKMRVKYSNKIATIISNITSDVKKIEMLEDELKLNENERKTFMGYVKELASSGQELKTIANLAETEKLKPTLENMVNICNSCHKQFRKIK